MLPTSPGPGSPSPFLDGGGRPLLNPALLYVDGNYALRLNAWCSVAGVTLGLRYRFLRAIDGQVVDSAEQLSPTANRVLTTTDLQLSNGFPLNVEVFALAGTPTIGQCFVQVQIVRGRGAAALATATLLQAYITATNARAWPGSLLESSLDGAGALRSIIGTTPGAGVEVTETVPAGVRWELLAFHVRLTTAVAAANRFVQLLLDDGTAIPYAQIYPFTSAHAASLVFPYSFYAGGPTNVGQAAFQGALPINLRLEAAHRVRTSTIAIQAADQYDQVQYLVREWLTAA